MPCDTLLVKAALRLALSVLFASAVVARQAIHQQYLGPPRLSKSVTKSFSRLRLTSRKVRCAGVDSRAAGVDRFMEAAMTGYTSVVFLSRLRTSEIPLIITVKEMYAKAAMPAINATIQINFHTPIVGPSYC